jgi:hypothetical protein
MLDAFLPLSFIARPVNPIHLTIAVPLVFFIVALVTFPLSEVKLPTPFFLMFS